MYLCVNTVNVDIYCAHGETDVNSFLADGDTGNTDSLEQLY